MVVFCWHNFVIIFVFLCSEKLLMTFKQYFQVAAAMCVANGMVVYLQM